MAVALGLMAASVALAAMGTGMGIYSSFANAEQAKRVSEAQQRQKQIEAQVATDNANFEAQQARRKAVLALGRQESIYGAMGFDPSEGSPLVMEVDNAKQYEIEALNIERGGKTAGETLGYEAAIARYRGALAQGAVPGEIASSLAQGAGSAASSYLSYKRYQVARVPSKPTVLSDLL